MSDYTVGSLACHSFECTLKGARGDPKVPRLFFIKSTVLYRGLKAF